MSTEIKLITLNKLSKYDALIKKYITDEDAKSIKSISITGRTLKFYTEESPEVDTVAIKEITVPETDLSTINTTIENLKTTVEKLDGVDTVEGSVKSQIKAVKENLETKITANADAIQAHKDTIDSKVATLIGEDANKSVRTIANEELTKQLIPEDAKESLDTLQEIANWIQSHPR